MSHTVNALIERLRTEGIGKSAEINPFWRDQLARLTRAFSKAGTNVTHEQLRGALGYNAQRLPAGVSKNADRPDWAGLMRCGEIPPIEGARNEVEHAGALAYLRRMGALDQYLAWVDGHGLASAMDLARHYWYAKRLRSVLEKPDGQKICLEVGVGSGRFASLLVETGIVRHYVLIDFPEMLLNAMLLVNELFPHAETRYGETPDFTQSGLVFWLLETGDIRRVPDAAVDIALNFYSFMEMDEQIRDFYIGEIYRVAAPGAIFYNVNRRQRGMTRLNGSTFENHPLLYPYRSSDRVLEWGPDDFNQSVRSERFFSPNKSFSISRIAAMADR